MFLMELRLLLLLLLLLVLIVHDGEDDHVSSQYNQYLSSFNSHLIHKVNFNPFKEYTVCVCM
jgi:hypothetical protein